MWWQILPDQTLWSGKKKFGQANKIYFGQAKIFLNVDFPLWKEFQEQKLFGQAKVNTA